MLHHDRDVNAAALYWSTRDFACALASFPNKWSWYLIDSTDISDFNTKLRILKPKWDLLCPVFFFFEWIVNNEVELMCSSMIASVDSTAGLGSPPKSFTTNESLNHLLKQKVDYNQNEWPAFIKLLQELCEQQQRVWEGCIWWWVWASWRVQQPGGTTMWIRMSPEQRQKQIEKVCKISFSAEEQPHLTGVMSSSS